MQVHIILILNTIVATDELSQAQIVAVADWHKNFVPVY